METSVLPRVPTVTVFMTERGFLLLLLPLVWTWLMVRKQSLAAVSGGGRPVVFFCGVLLLLGLCFLGVWSILQPWNVLFSLSSVLSSGPAPH